MKKYFLSFCVLIGLLTAAQSSAIDSRSYIDRAVALIEEGDFSLARSYLEPALVDPYIPPDLRSKAFYLRGYSYFAQGLPVSSLRDFNRALEFSPNNPVVLFMVGRAHYEGLGTKADPALGVELFQRSVDAGHQGASAYLGFALLQGNGISKDLTRARSLLSAVAEGKGDAFAMVQMARSYRQEATDSPDPAMARMWYERAFAAGEANAFVALAYMYSKDEFELSEAAADERSFELLKQAMDAGAESAYARLAYAYLSGIGTAVNYDRAFQLFMAGVELGQAQSFAGIAHMFEAGLGRSVDLQQAESWYLRGIEAGDEYAHSAFAYMLLGIDQDDRALQWLSRATKFGGAQSHNDLAWLLATSEVGELRDGDLSLQHALKAVGLEASAAYLDTLAAAYAESGLFEDALVTQEQAIAAALDEDESVQQELEQHLLSYQKQKPWRE
tara:strand:+ start:863 stop:2194 length:1332 start_codon:yes stop_codon:yes gene_type:complete